MIQSLIKIKIGDLVLLSLAPVLLYITGFALTGKQVFDPTAQPKQDAQVVQKIDPVDVQAPSELEKNEEERSKEKQKTVEANKKALKSIDDIQKKSAVITNLDEKPDSEAESKPVIPSEQSRPVNKPVKQKTRPSSYQPVKTEQVVEKETKPENDDPYASFNWESEQSTGAASKKTVPSEKSGIYYEANFLTSGTLSVKEDKTIQLINIEDIPLSNGKTIPKNTVMTGFITYNSERFFIDVRTVDTRKLNFPVNLSVYDNSYTKGIAYKSVDEMADEVGNELDDIMNQATDKVSFNTPVGSVSLPSRKRNNKIEVYISKSSTFKLLEE